jgi:hypothetical protein
VLPIVGLRAFEIPKSIPIPQPVLVLVLVLVPSTGTSAIVNQAISSGDDVVVIVPAQEEGFKAVFLGENSWRAIRISGGKVHQIRYVAAHQTKPISAITHYAKVAAIEPYREGGKY